jgi:pSer/pThr/pTyr-binding forkhead associated (FHA) protein
MQLGRVGCETAPGEYAEWTVVVGRGFLAVLPVGTGTPVIAALHALAAEVSVTVEALVALIPLGGPDDVDDFALIVPGAGRDGDPAGGDPVPHDGIPVHAVVRGALAIDVFSIGGSRRFTDRNVRPWLLAEFQAVTGVVIGSQLAPVPRAGSLGAGRSLLPGIHTGDTVLWSVIGQGVDDTILRPRRIVDGTVLLDHRPRPAGSASPSSPSRTATAGPPGPPVAPDPADAQAGPPGRYGFRLADGDERSLDRVYRIGRNPRPLRMPGSEPLELLTVPSPSAMVSNNHLEIRQDGDAVVVTDLGSTNGTLVRFSLGRTQRLRSGASLTVLPGTTVDIGDGNLIEILPAG